MTKFIRDPFTGTTFTLKEWEIEKQRRKEQMAKEWWDGQRKVDFFRKLRNRIMGEHK